ncbi:MAG: twin-arginine translocation signal domain-containing protein, partial [Phycisphaerales bacterium]
MSGMEVDRREFLKASAGAAAVVALMPELGLASTLSAADEVALGLIGAGRQGRAILTELQKLSAARVASVCDTDASRLESGLRRTQGASGDR